MTAYGVGLNYLDTFQAPLIRGRAFTESDLAPGRHVAIVDRTFARTVFNGVREAAADGNPRRIVADTFASALAKVTIGLVLGSIPAAAIVSALGPEVGGSAATEVAIGTGVAATLLVAIVTALACVFPARRALRIQPMDASKTT